MQTFLPREIQELVGQKHLFGKGKPLYRMLEEKRVYSTLLWGPPGCGKSSFLHILKKQISLPVHCTSALDFQLKAFQNKMPKGGLFYDSPMVLFLEEIHHLNRRQQDFFLPLLEKGEMVLYATTTENPYYLLRSSLLSRMQVYSFQPLAKEELLELLENILSRLPLLQLTEKLKDSLVARSGGDGRRLVFMLSELSKLQRKKLTVKDLSLIGEKGVSYDQKGDAHYQNISAFIKSLRGSDPDAALFYLARMLQGGEDPRFIARRMMILASEDIGNADPHALTLANASYEGVEKVGLPEAELVLAHTAVYLAAAPKSNACYVAWQRAKGAAEKFSQSAVPEHLRNPVKQAKELDWGKGYCYPHDFKGHFVAQRYLPEEVEGGFYLPTENGREKEIKKRLEQLSKREQTDEDISSKP